VWGAEEGETKANSDKAHHMGCLLDLKYQVKSWGCKRLGGKGEFLWKAALLQGG